MAIVIFHSREAILPVKFEGFVNFTGYFNVFVSYFFVLSGFILTINYHNMKGVKQFYINRFARIYPLYLFAFLLTVALMMNARTPNITISFGNIFTTLFLIQSWFSNYAVSYNYPAWSLSVEAFFYLLFPFVIYLLRNQSLRKQLLLVFLFWLITQLVFGWMTYSTFGFGFSFYYPLSHLSSFLMGVAGGKFFLSNPAFLIKNTFRLELISVIALVVISYLIISRNIIFFKLYHNGLLAPFFIMLIYTVTLSRRKIINAFNHKRLQYLGEISYGIYILQVPVLILVTGLVDRSIKTSATTTFYIYVPILILFAAVTHELIEKPCGAFLKNRLTKSGIV